MARKAIPVDAPWSPPTLDEHEVRAIKALAAGKANEGQQILAVQTIVNKIAQTYSLSFRAGEDGPRATDFAEGKRFVGDRIVRAINGPMPAPAKQ